ncbi:MAG TPA: HepT-like ribonuclease domain-containing protein [Dissulfurispiraceae bacterium]
MEIYYRKLELIEDCLKRLAEIKKENPTLEKYRKSWKDKDSSERNLQKIIEAFIDIGKMMVAEKRLREPGNNREIILDKQMLNY